MEDFTRSIKLGTQHSGRGGFLPVCVEIEWAGGRLSITGNIGQGHWGQIHDSLTGPNANWSKMSPGWNYKRICQLKRAWKRWTNNGTIAGTPDQMYVLRQVREDLDTYPDYYGVCCNILEQVGLYRDEKYDSKGVELPAEEYASCVAYRDRCRAHGEDFVWGYKYRSKWLKEDVPLEVVRWLKECPDGGNLPYWDLDGSLCKLVPSGTLLAVGAEVHEHQG